MATESYTSWDLAGRLLLRVDGLDAKQTDAVRAELDPFSPAASTADADVVLGVLYAPDPVESQGPSHDGRTTALSRNGRLLARFGAHWVEVPAPGDFPVHVNVQPGLSLGSCWAEVVRPALHQALRRRNTVAVHAAAVDGGSLGGTLLSGWSESGKTEVALALMEAGANFLSDKWTVAGPDGVISAFPVGVGVRGWVMKDLPQLQASLPARARAQLAAARLLRAVSEPVLNRTGRGRVAALGKGMVLRAVELGDRAGLSPTALRRAYGQVGDPARRVPLDTVVVLLTGRTDEVRVEDSTPAWAAQRLARTAAYERRRYYDLQERGAYAGLSHRSGARDSDCAVEESLLRQAFGSARVLSVTCPFPGDPRRVVDALAAHR
jgi:hypothetical protein